MEGPEFPIYRDLRQKILAGDIQDGDRLTETALAREYNASRLHIKSALRLLEQEHLAAHIPQRGFFAQGVTENDLLEINDMRIALERVVFARLLDRVSTDDIARMRHMTKRIGAFMATEMLEDAMAELDEFYRFAYELSSCWRIVAILETYDEYLKFIRRRSVRLTDSNEESLYIVERIIDALEQHDYDTLMTEIERRRLDSE